MLSQCLFVCLCVVASSYGSATGNLVPFIEPCVWNDETCLVSSTKKAMPYFAKGLPEFGLVPMDPLKMSKVTLVEGDLKVEFTKMDVTGTSKCNILKVTRDISKNTLKIAAECPIDVVGHYDASGKLLFVPIEGNGPFHVNCKLIYIEVLVEITSEVGSDGVAYWKIGKSSHSYEPKEKCTFNFENLFNGDMEKAGPVMAVFNENWKDIILSIGKPIVGEILDEAVKHIQTFCSKVPADQLEKQ